MWSFTKDASNGRSIRCGVVSLGLHLWLHIVGFCCLDTEKVAHHFLITSTISNKVVESEPVKLKEVVEEIIELIIS